MNDSDPDGCNFFPSKSLTANALESVLLTSGMPKMSLFAFFSSTQLGLTKLATDDAKLVYGSCRVPAERKDIV